MDLSDATLCGDGACRRREMQVRLRLRFDTGDPLRRSSASKARNAGEITKIVCLEGSLPEWVMFIGFVAPRAGKMLTFLGMSRVKRS